MSWQEQRTGQTSSSQTRCTAEQPPSSLVVLPVRKSRLHHCSDTGVLVALPEAVATRSQPTSSLPHTVTDLVLLAGSPFCLSSPRTEAQLITEAQRRAT